MQFLLSDVFYIVIRLELIRDKAKDKAENIQFFNVNKSCETTKTSNVFICHCCPGPTGPYKRHESIKRGFANTLSSFSEKRTHFLKKQEE